MERTAPCPPAPARTSGSAQPRAATNATDLDYPDAMKKLDVEGFVILSATISFAGCPLKAEVFTPSGVPEFDQAALRSILGATFLPAERDHKPVQAVMRLGVRFQMRRAPSGLVPAEHQHEPVGLADHRSLVGYLVARVIRTTQ
jgi:TonB family protein